MTAVLGSVVARRDRLPLYLDIRDIFADTINEVLPRAAAPAASIVFSALERLTFGRAQKINLVSGGFEHYFRQRYPRIPLSFFTNGIDDEFVAAASKIDARRKPAAPLRIVYAGNMGEGQGLHAIVPALAKRLTGRACFRIIGDGGRRRELERRLLEFGVDNVTVSPPVARDALMAEYREADVLFLHLNDYRAFEKVLPSKVFEYAALGKPVLAGVAGYAARFMRDEVSNAVVFKPCDAVDAERALANLVLGDVPRADFVAKYARASIAARMADDIMGTIASER